jgi:co-chaperonin GroES (HSP10)
MAIPFAADGVTPGGIVIVHAERKFKSLAIVIETNTARSCDCGDIVLYKEGFADSFIDKTGEEFFLIDEGHIVSIFHNITLQEDRTITSYDRGSLNTY